MANGTHYGRRARYEIRVEGVLGEEWSAWFDGFTVTAPVGGETLLAGEVTDQPALHGVLAAIGQLGLPLVSVQRQTARQDT